ncbi:hypothetical protein KIN20_003051 [Parelaphostrongylus tenuis]|uniref:Uncharacterized protein n=1 Tax=Parelaphostrongylus tenuis TaxID=148309 RepID=A0AAD5LYL5_PARTN|nr:hypothetical protein KIN20_003051 [Parelaphostrongylus tenuis]
MDVLFTKKLSIEVPLRIFVINADDVLSQTQSTSKFLPPWKREMTRTRRGCHERGALCTENGAYGRQGVNGAQAEDMYDYSPELDNNKINVTNIHHAGETSSSSIKFSPIHQAQRLCML